MNELMEPIALIGIACEFAGGISTPNMLWNVLKNSIDVGSEIPKERFDVDSYAPFYHSKRPLIRRGYFLNENQIHNFDPSFFGITDGEALGIDPCHRILLEKFLHLIEDADYTVDRIKGTRTSVFIGQFSNDHMVTFHRSKQENQINLTGPNLSFYNASARISYHFDLHGPNLTLDTACSSSLQAVHLAVQSLRNREADFAVAGGANLNYTPESFFAALLSGAVSPDGRSRSYSDDGNGYAKSEGVGLVLLKRLSDAIRDKDKVYCVIRDVLASHDGNEGKTGYNVPSSVGQTRLLNEVYMRSNTDLKSIFYVEGHGTGTPVGDPIEANTLGKFFNRSSYDSPLLIGSVKSVLGHTEGTAGVASLIKVALCMKYRMITPNMNFNRTNPKIKATAYNLHVVNHPVQFPNDSINIGINCFGIGGNTAHVIVSECPKNNLNSETVQSNQNEFIQNDEQMLQQSFVLSFSAKCEESLKKNIEKFSSWLAAIPEDFINRYQSLFFSNLCEKLLLKRTTSFSYRLSFVFSNYEQLQGQIKSYLADEKNCPGVIYPLKLNNVPDQVKFNICFIYTGQGPQWWAMGRQLYSTEPVFRQWIDKLHLEFLRVTNNSFSLINELIEPKQEEYSNINQTNIAQPAILAIQISLTALWLSWGIRPTTVIGHSVGEVAAAYVAGRITLSEAVEIIYHRSRVQNYNTNKGGRMMALFLSEDETNQIIDQYKDQVQIAAINSPKSVTLSGDDVVLENIYNDLSKSRPKVFKSWLRIQNAFHSKQMERFNIYEELIDSLKYIKGDSRNQEFDSICSNAKLYSTVTGERNDNLYLDGEYWWQNVRNPVLFDTAMQAIFEDMTQSNGIPIFIEISPHPVLSAALFECFHHFNQSHSLFSYQSPLIVHSLVRKQNEQQTIVSSLCQLYSSSGLQIVDWNKYFHSRIYSRLRFASSNHNNNESHQLIYSFINNLPLYMFNHQICWYETKDSVFSRRALRKKVHPLLGYRQWHNQSKWPTWKNILTIEKHSNSLSYLNDHNVQGNILFPASAFIELILSAINQLLLNISSQQQSIILKEIHFLNGLVLNENESVHIETVVTMPFRHFYIYSRRIHEHDSIRIQGINGNDIITDYSDENILHMYASKEWTLHCRGSIHLDFDSALITSIYDPNSILNRFLSSKNNKTTIIAQNENDVQNFYTYLKKCGLNYGSRFQCIQYSSRLNNEALTQLNIPLTLMNDNGFDENEHICHPTILDACFHSMVSLIPGEFYETGIPVYIDELILMSRNTNLISILKEPNKKLYAFQSLHKTIKGLSIDKTSTADIVVFSSDDKIMKSDPMIVIRGFKNQHHIDETLKTTTFDKIEESVSPINANSKKIVDTDEIIDNYCAYKHWKKMDLIESNYEFLSKTMKEQKWIIFCDEKQKIAEHFANVLLEHQVKCNNIQLIYYSDIQITSADNKFKTIFLSTQTTLPTDIYNIINENINSDEQSLQILFAWPLDLTMFDDIQTDLHNFQKQETIGCASLMFIVQSIYQMKCSYRPNIFVLTENSQFIDNGNINQTNFNINQSPIIGFARSIVNEYEINRMKLIDIQINKLSREFYRQLLNEVLFTMNCSNEHFYNEEIVLMSKKNFDLIERYIPAYSMMNSLTYENEIDKKLKMIPNTDSDQIHFQLKLPKSRIISDMKWIQSYNSTSEKSLLPTQVEVKIHSVAVNFRDILKSRGLYPYTYEIEDNFDNDEILGMDFSGFIVRKGSQVKDFDINDRIFGMITDQSAFKSHVIMSQNNIFRIPNDLTMEQSSTLPTYVPVIYALRDVIQLKANQTVLIHSAAGATGLAFIRYCQIVGAKIIATAGTEEKRRFLRENCKIEHVFNSRNLSFVSEIRHITPNGCVDVIINSLSALFIEESLKLLSPFGHFVELGKRDLYANSKFSLFQLKSNCHFHVIDLVTLQKYKPDIIYSTLNDISNMVQKQVLTVIEPIKVFETNEIQEAFTIYSRGTHIGKFVIKIAASCRPLELCHDPIEYRLEQQTKVSMFSDLVCNHGTVVISGGLGGIGIEMSKWMIKDRGVKQIVLLSRRKIEDVDENSSLYHNWLVLQQIASDYNASVKAVKADICELAQLIDIFAKINRTNDYPIRSIIHSAMVLHDSLVQNMTPEMLTKVMQPKIRGAWNLHRASEITSCPIESFIMFSSIRNHITDLGQSNYNAGNNFLDSLAYWRFYCRKLPAISISLPAISGAGYLHHNTESVVKLMQGQGIHLLPIKYVFNVIERFHHIQQQTNRYSTPIMFVVNWRTLLNMNLPEKLVNFANEYLGSHEKQNVEKASKHNDLSIFDIEKLTNTIRIGVSKLFGSLNVNNINVHKSLIQQGMDSLIAVELRSWLVKETAINIPLVELLQGVSINDIALFIQKKHLSKETTTKNVNSSQNRISKMSENHFEDSLFNVEENQKNVSDMPYSGTSLITPLHSSTFKSSLFCVHDIIGLSQTFIQMCNQFKEMYRDRSPSIFAIRSSGYQSNETVFQSIESMAEEYILQLKRIQPTGPYQLMGYSFGGLVAYEIARQLCEKHRASVRSLILIDPLIPSQENDHNIEINVAKKLSASKANQFIYDYFTKDKHFNLSSDYYRNLSYHEDKIISKEDTLSILKQRFSLISDDENEDNLIEEKIFEIIKNNLLSKDNYNYNSIKDSSSLIAVDNVVMFTLKNNETNKIKHQIWKTLFPKLIIKQVDGSHRTLLQMPTVNTIVNQIKEMNIL